MTSAPIEHALAAYANVDQLARRLKTADETRTLDQLRADTMLDLLMGKQFGGEVRTHCYLYLDATTYAGLNNKPAELAGHGLIPAWLAKEMCSGRNTVFQRIITEPQSGQVAELGEAKHSSTGNVTELVRVRDRECRRPGCTKPAKLTELELCEHHDGRTESAHIGTCAADHKLPATRGWHHTLEADGSLIVTTPSGETYTSRPEPLHEPRSIQDDAQAGTGHQGHTYCRCA